MSSTTFVPATSAQPTLPTVPPTNLDIYVLMGQSNMSGAGRLEEMPSGYPKHPSKVWLFSNAWTWELATEPVDSPTGQLDEISLDPFPGVGVGPGLSFADALVDQNPNQPIAVVPCAKGGTTIQQWNRSKIKYDDRSTLYGSCLQRIRAARKYGNIKAILWYQGESDAKKTENTINSASAKTWPMKFSKLVADLRTDLQIQNLPVVYAQIGKLLPDQIYHRPADYYSFWDEVKKQQALVQIAHAKMIATDHLDVGLDGLHLTTASQLKLGPEFARAVLDLRDISCRQKSAAARGL